MDMMEGTTALPSAAAVQPQAEDWVVPYPQAVVQLIRVPFLFRFAFSIHRCILWEEFSAYEQDATFLPRNTEFTHCSHNRLLSQTHHIVSF